MIGHRGRDTAGGAIGLRSWAARRLLFGHTATPPPPASEAAWRLFLFQERCAALLRESLDAAPVAVDPAGAAVLGEAARFELRHVLAARAQLGLIADLARRHGWDVMALKGAAEIARGRNVQVMDVDVLADPRTARSLADALDAQGFLPATDADGPYHLAPRFRAGGLAIEIHTAVTGFDNPARVPWNRAVPLPATTPLLSLAPGDHAWTVVSQATLKHPDRRTRIRDLVMLAVALKDCDPAARARLDHEVAASPFASEGSEMVARATIDDPAADHDPRIRKHYLFLARRPTATPDSVAGRWLRYAREIAASDPDSDRRRRAELRRRITVQRPPLRRLASAVLHSGAAVAARLLTLDAGRFR